MSNIALTINLTGPTWAWYLLGAAVIAAMAALAVKTAFEAWTTYMSIKLSPLNKKK